MVRVLRWVVGFAVVITAGLFGYDFGRDHLDRRRRSLAFQSRVRESLEGLRSEDPVRRQEGAAGLDTLLNTPYAEWMEAKRRGLAYESDSRSLSEGLSAALEDDAPMVRLHAARALLGMRDRELIARGARVLFELIAADVRTQAGDAIGVYAGFSVMEARSAESGDVFVKGLDHPSPRVRHRCALALAHSGRNEGMEHLLRGLNEEENPLFLIEAIEALRKRRDTRGLDQFRVLATSHTDPRVRRAAQEALGPL